MNKIFCKQAPLWRVGGLLLFSTLLVSVFTCHEEGHEHHDSHSAGHFQHKHKAHGQTVPLTLNVGKKWQMDVHTRKSIQAMAMHIENARGKSGNLKFLKNTGKSLESEMQRLIRGCTMTGEAHEQLHRILPALQEATSGLAKAADLTAAQASLKNLEELMAKYHRFFE